MEVQSMDKGDAAGEKGVYHVVVMGSGVDFLLLLFKFSTEIVGYSTAALTDAVHSLSDFVTNIIVIVFVHIPSRPEDEGHDYGHGKHETLATIIIGIVLLFVGFGILWNGTLPIYHFLYGGSLQEPRMLVLITALVSIIFKEVLYHYTVFRGKKLSSQAMAANAWHHRSDALSSIGTTVGIGGAILLGNHQRALDPIAVVAVGFFIMKVAIKLLVPCVNELSGELLPADVESEMQKIILSSPRMNSPHHLRIRRVGSYYAIEVYMRMDSNIALEEARRTATAIESTLKERFGKGTHVGIHVELVKEITHNL